MVPWHIARPGKVDRASLGRALARTLGDRKTALATVESWPSSKIVAGVLLVVGTREGRSTLAGTTYVVWWELRLTAVANLVNGRQESGAGDCEGTWTKTRYDYFVAVSKNRSLAARLKNSVAEAIVKILLATANNDSPGSTSNIGTLSVSAGTPDKPRSAHALVGGRVGEVSTE